MQRVIARAWPLCTWKPEDRRMPANSLPICSPVATNHPVRIVRIVRHSHSMESTG